MNNIIDNTVNFLESPCKQNITERYIYSAFIIITAIVNICMPFPVCHCEIIIRHGAAWVTPPTLYNNNWLGVVGVVSIDTAHR